MKVIIADDEKKVCQLIKKLVDWEKLGMSVEAVAHDGFAVLEAIKKINPDIVISDIRMPGCDGLEMIENARRFNPEISFIIISGYQQFEYAKRAIQYGVKDYLLKPISQKALIQTLDNIRIEYERKQYSSRISNLLKKDIESKRSLIRAAYFTEVLHKQRQNQFPSTIEDINREYAFCFGEGYYQIGIVKIDGQRIAAQESEYIYAKLLQEIENSLAGYCMDYETHFEFNRLIVLMNYESNKIKEVRRGLKSFLNNLLLQQEIFNNVTFTLGIGSAESQFEDVGRSLKMANYAVEQRLVIGTNRIIEVNCLYKSQFANSKLFHEFNRKFVFALECFNEIQLREALTWLKDSLLQTYQITGYEIVQMCKEALNLYMITMRRLQIPVRSSENFFEDCCDTLDNIGNIEDIFSWLSRELTLSLRKGMECRQQMDSRPIRVAKNYIDENFNKNITLEHISHMTGFNSAYFNTLFKKETGVTILEYLTALRMNRARELLRDTRMSVAMICEEVGYSDVKHFTKKFKNITGLKPNEYRKIYS